MQRGEKDFSKKACVNAEKSFFNYFLGVLVRRKNLVVSQRKNRRFNNEVQHLEKSKGDVIINSWEKEIYEHLKMEERGIIGQMYWASIRISEIAHAIGRDRVAVARELKRNSPVIPLLQRARRVAEQQKGGQWIRNANRSCFQDCYTRRLNVGLKKSLRYDFTLGYKSLRNAK